MSRPRLTPHMQTIVVVHSLQDWPFKVPDIQAVTASSYLTSPEWIAARGVRVVNLCRTYAYQGEGYYVSLLASGRNHRPFPDLRTVLDMKNRHRVRTVDEELDALIQKSLSDIQASEFDLSIYFGKNLAQRHSRLAQRLFGLFPVPLQRAHFVKGRRWRVTSIAPIATRDVPETHRAFVAEAAHGYLSRPRRRARKQVGASYDLGILYDPNEELAPSDGKALARFRRAARHVGFDVQMLQKDDYARVAEFDAIFLRETTAVDHHTFRIAQRAEAAGVIVIDDTTSILRSTNKVFQAETLSKHNVRIPNTFITNEADAQAIIAKVGLPCVLKHPDSSFSQGVFKCSTPEETVSKAKAILEQSDLLVAQEYLPTGFDWRIGTFAGEVLYACRYEMAKGHWQIAKRTKAGKMQYGKVEPIALEQVPPEVIKQAKRAAAAFGDSLYGVDLKTVDNQVYVTEVNDNPNIDGGCEDALLGDELYRRIMQGMLDRVLARKERLS